MSVARGEAVVVLGAGIVGVCCALELQRRGFAVTLVDRGSPGRETSFGNAGVIARSSLIPFNSPTLWSALPRLLRHRSPGFRYRPGYLLSNPRWAIGFVSGARRAACEETTAALDALIRLSMDEHRRLMREADVLHRLRDDGWLFLYRSRAAFDGGAASRRTLADFGVDTQALDVAQVRELEPSLNPIFTDALWVRDAWSVDGPGDVVAAYADLFRARGGEIVEREISALRRDGASWRLTGPGGPALSAPRVVVALGPWSKTLLATIGVDVPMAFERGYHRHYGRREGATLNRSVYDTAGGYVMSPMSQGIRVTTGVELTDLAAPSNFAQLELAERAAREAFPLAAAVDEAPWRGARPTLPDSRPMIGAAPRLPGLWLAFGHQHIGFSTGPGTARLLGALMTGEASPIDARPFRAERFLS